MHDWETLEAVPATVMRILGPLVSLRYLDRKTTVRWPSGVPVWVGRELTARCYTDPPRLQSLVVVGVEVEGQRHWVDEAAIARWSLPHLPSTPPAFLPALVEAGLLDRAEIDSRFYDSGPVGVVMAHYGPRGALDRGFVHYDHRWGNDTKDPIADLAWMLRRNDMRCLRVQHVGLRFELGTTAYEGDDLWEVASLIDHWLATMESPTRLFAWDTHADAYAFLARPLDEGLALARALDDDGLVPASQQDEYPSKGDRDYF